MNGMGPARLTLRGLQLAPGVSALIALLVLASAFLAVAAPRQTNGVLTSALHTSLGGSAGALALSSDVTGGTTYAPKSLGGLAASVWPKLRSQLSDIRQGMPPDLAAVAQPAEFVGTANGTGNGFAGSGTPTSPKTIPSAAYTLEAAPSLRDEARLVAGRWPGPVRTGQPIDVVIAAKAASALHWKIGQTQGLAGTTDGKGSSVVLVGTVAPRNAASAFWSLSFDRGQLRTHLNSDGTTSYFGRVWIDADSWPSLAPTLQGVDVSAWYGIDLDAITADRASIVAAEGRRFLAQGQNLGLRSSDEGPAFTSSLPAALEDFASRSASSTALIALFELGPAGALAAVLVLGLRLLQSRRSRVGALIRARGASGWQLRSLAAAELAVWVVPAAIIGAAVAVLLTAGMGSAGVAVTTAILCALAAPVVAAALAEQPDSRARGALVGRAARPVAEATIVLIAVLALVVLVARGQVTASSRIDPLVELAPLLLAVAVTVVVSRLMPFGVRWSGALVRRSRSAVSLVAASGAGYAPRGGAWALFALVVGVGMSVFSLTMVATQQQGVEQAALSLTGSDVAVSSIGLSAHAVHELEGLPGVAAHATVQSIGEVTLPQSNVTLYSVVPAELASVQRGIDNSPLLAVHGQDTAVADANNPPVTSRLDVTGQKVLRLNRVDPDTVSLVLSDPDWMLVDRAELPRTGVYPTTVGVLLRLHAGVDPSTVAGAAQRAAGSDATVRTAAHAGAAIIGSPVDRAVHLTIILATTLAGLLCLVVFVMTLAAGAAERLRRGAILRAMGFDRRQSAALVFADVVPSAVVGVVVGALTGLGLAVVVLHTIEPTAFIGAPIPIGLAVDIPTTAVVLVGFLAAALLASTVAVIIDLARPATAGLQTLGEER